MRKLSAVALTGASIVALSTHLANAADTVVTTETVTTIISGPDGLQKTGAGTATLTAINTYTGATTIDAGGTLALSGSGRIAASSGVAVSGTFDISGTNSGTSIMALTGAGSVVLGANTLTLSAASGAFSGVIDGAGGLIINGGSQTLSSANTYTGGTIIGGGTTLTLTGSGSIASSSSVQASGTLDISATTSGASIKTLTGGGKVVLGAKTLTISAASGSFVNVIEGTGGLTIAGGTQKLDFMNTYTGKTTIDSGATLALTGQGRVNKSSGVEVNGTFDISASVGTQIKALTGSGTVQLGGTSLSITNASGTFSGAIHGTSGISIESGTQILTGDNDFSGSTGISSGATLQIGDGGATGSITGNVLNYGTLAFNRTGELTYAGNLTGPKTGTVTVSGVGKLILTGANSGNGAIIAAGSTLQFGNGGTNGLLGGVNPGNVTNNGTLIYNLAGAQKWKGAYSGSGTIEQAGTGSLALTGDSSGFTGSTTVSSGSLVVGVGGVGKLGGNVLVKSGASFGGSGTIGGDVTILSGGIFEVKGKPTGLDTLTVGGTVDISGATLKLALSPNTATSWNPLNGPFTIIDKQSAGAVTGTFASVENNLLFLDDTINYAGGTGNDVTVTLTRNDLSVGDVADTANQQAVGGAIDQLGAGNPLALAILLLTSEDAARLALDGISGEAQASVKGMFIQDSHFIIDAATNRIRSALDGTPTASLPVMAYGEGGPEMVAADSNRFVVWGQAFGSWGDIKGNSNAAGIEHSTGGFIAGGDGAIGETWRLGLLTGYSHSSFDVADRASSGSSDNYHLGVYGGGQWGNFGVRGGAAYSWHRIETDRSVGLPGFSDALTANYDAGTAQVYGEASYKIDTQPASFEPFANLAYVNLHTDGFTESGGAAALTAAASTTDTTFTTLGVRASTDLSLGSLPVTARGTLGWRHAFGDVTPISQVAFVGSDPFSIAGTPIARDAAIVEAGIDLTLSAKATLGLTYSGQFGGGSSDNGFKARFGLEF